MRLMGDLLLSEKSSGTLMSSSQDSHALISSLWDFSPGCKLDYSRIYLSWNTQGRHEAYRLAEIWWNAYEPHTRCVHADIPYMRLLTDS